MYRPLACMLFIVDISHNCKSKQIGNFAAVMCSIKHDLWSLQSRLWAQVWVKPKRGPGRPFKTRRGPPPKQRDEKDAIPEPIDVPSNSSVPSPHQVDPEWLSSVLDHVHLNIYIYIYGHVLQVTVRHIFKIYMSWKANMLKHSCLRASYVVIHLMWIPSGCWGWCGWTRSTPAEL